MPITTLSVVGGSAAVLFVLVVLFRKEATRGERVVFPGVRARLDIAVLAVGNVCRSVLSYLGAGMFRSTIHYIMHHVLGAIIDGLMRVQQKLFELHDRHVKMSRAARGATERDSHLDAIAAHKEETALSESEKRKMKAHH